MESNRVRKIHDLGQSIWLDFFDRDIMNTGILKKLIEDNGISGITSNPSIFKKAITIVKIMTTTLQHFPNTKTATTIFFLGL